MIAVLQHLWGEDPTVTLPIISELFMTSMKTEGIFLRDG
jgi:hypothetical protein